jgi:hypothetical protein
VSLWLAGRSRETVGAHEARELERIA